MVSFRLMTSTETRVFEEKPQKREKNTETYLVTIPVATSNCQTLVGVEVVALTSQFPVQY